jgi:hypothetical protein
MDETRETLDPEAASRLTEFARAYKAALRAVTLYPPAHPAIGATIGRLTELAGGMTADGPFAVGVRPGTLHVGNRGPAKPDPAIVELSELLRRYSIGSVTLNGGADGASWRTLLMLLGRPPEEVRADGGIAHLWATAGGPSIELQEIDYAEVLREKQGDAATVERVIAAALSGRGFDLDDASMAKLLEIVGDPARLEELMKQLEASTSSEAPGTRIGAFLNMLRGLAEYVGRTNPAQLSQVLKQLSHAAGRLSAEGMLDLLARGSSPQAMAGPTNVVTGIVDRMTDSTVAEFVSTNVIAERGATERLAQAFQTLVPEIDRQRQLLALAEQEVASSELGQEANFAELWASVETMMTSYSDESFVSAEYGRELSTARLRAVEVEAISDDPPERIATWVATVSDTELRNLDLQLLVDLLSIEREAPRWRDVADTVAAHADDLVRVGRFDHAWRLVDAIATEAQKGTGRGPAAQAALLRFGHGAMMKHVGKHLRSADDDEFERLKRLCHMIGPSLIVPLAEVLSTEQDARSRRRLRDVLVAFGAAGRESVQRLMNAPNWEVRRTAAFLLREFGGSEGLRELQPLLTDSEPLVQREAVQALVLNGSDVASQILAQGLNSTSGRPRATLLSELLALRDEKAGPLFSHFIRQLDRRKFPVLYVSVIDALGSSKSPETVAALQDALKQGDWWAPLRTRKTRAAAARALRVIGTPAAIEALRDASARGAWGVRAAARTELGHVG